MNGRRLELAGLVLIALLVTGCGYALRGPVRLPAELSPLHLSTVDPGGPLRRELEQGLRDAGVRLANGPEGAAHLRVLVDRIEQQVLSVGETARVREFQLVYRVEFELWGADGSLRLPRQAVELRRDYGFDEAQALGAAAEEALLRAELQREMPRRVLDQLARGLSAAGAEA